MKRSTEMYEPELAEKSPVVKHKKNKKKGKGSHGITPKDVKSGVDERNRSNGTGTGEKANAKESIARASRRIRKTKHGRRRLEVSIC